MNRKTAVWIGLTVGSTLGGLLPYLWDPSAALSPVLFSAIGGLVGIWAGFKVGS